MKALVIVSEVNSARTLDRCLLSLLAQDYLDMKIIVVDGGSTDGSIEIARQYEPAIELLILPGISEAEGQNIGIESFPSHLILLTNSDCYVERDWVSRRVEWHEHGYELVGGKLFWGGDGYAFTWSYITPDLPTERLGTGLSLGFSNCSMTRELYDRLGGFKDMKSQHDLDFFARALKGNAKIILDPKIEVYHDHPFRTFSGSFIRAFSYGFNHVILLKQILGKNWRGYMQYPYAQVTLLDALGIHGVRVYRQQAQEARQHGIKMNLIHFMILRQFGEFYATKLGWLLGLMAPSKVGVVDVRRK